MRAAAGGATAAREFGHAHLGASILTSVGTAGFAWNQNRGGVIGGPIHWSKAMWLNMTLLAFILLPFAWWRSSTAGPEVRRALGLTSASFVARGVAELPLVYVTPPRWKCGYGISHDAFAFATLGALLVRDRERFERGRDGRALAFSGFTMVLLVIEGIFAKRFRAIMDPSTGIYFADDLPQFRSVIRMTKTVVAVAYPLLAAIMWCARRDFPRGGRGAR